MFKQSILFLMAIPTLGDVGGSSVIDVTEAHYTSRAVDFVYRYGDEPWPEETLGWVETRWDTTDLLMRGAWDPESGGSWVIRTEEWQVTLELADPPWRVEFGGPTRPQETFYGFYLGLERLDGTWSHTFEHLGGWSEWQPQPYEPLGDVLLGESVRIGETRVGETDFNAPRNVPLTYPSFEPFNIQNGGTTDAGWDYWLLLYGSQLTLADIPVNEEWWTFSLGIGFSEVGYGEGDLLARIGLGHEAFRATTVIPEPGMWSLLAAGLVLMVGCARKRTPSGSRQASNVARGPCGTESK